MRFHYLLPDLTGVEVHALPGDKLAVFIMGLNDTVELVGTREQLAEVAQAILSIADPPAPIAEHNIRLLPTDPAKTHAVRDEWRTECSCGWAGPPDAGQGPACEHWLAHMQELNQ